MHTTNPYLDYGMNDDGIFGLLLFELEEESGCGGGCEYGREGRRCGYRGGDRGS